MCLGMGYDLFTLNFLAQKCYILMTEQYIASTSYKVKCFVYRL